MPIMASRYNVVGVYLSNLYYCGANESLGIIIIISVDLHLKSIQDV